MITLNTEVITDVIRLVMINMIPIKIEMLILVLKLVKDLIMGIIEN
jgi:hypothetical protein